jgi:hypothetical protein
MDRQQALQLVSEIRKASSSGISPEIVSMKLRLPLRLVRRVLAGRMKTEPSFSPEKGSSLN